MKHLLLLFICIFFASCADKKAEIGKPIFAKKYHLTGSTTKLELIIQPPNEMILYNLALLLFRPGGCVAKVYDSKTFDDIGVFGPIGKGPDEFLCPYYAGGADSSLYVYDMTLAQLSQYQLSVQNDSLYYVAKNKIMYQKDDVSISNMYCLENGYKIAKVVNGADHLLALIDSNMNFIRSFCNPLHLPPNALIDLHGDFSASKNQVIFACFEAGYIGSFTVGETGEIRTDWEYQLSDPIYSQYNKNRVDLEQSLVGFCGVKVVGNYVFALYSGSKAVYGARNHIPRTIFIFTLSGDPVAEITVNKSCSRFAISPDLRIIYGFFLDDTGEGLITFDCSHIPLERND